MIMNKETIEKAIRELKPHGADDCKDRFELGKVVGFTRGFLSGTEWRINAVWHDAEKEKPDADKPYLAVVETPNATVYAVWQGYANHPFWKKWAYISDLVQ